jgi:GTP diphosphokinase / guanosine-3',5'-bis(diphosphate) 3'-diphosphatase
MQPLTDDNIGLILMALRFSAAKHRDQRRKDIPQSPYINHPIEVAETLWQVGGVRDTATLLAAILHDTIEDTQTTPEELENLFGAEVLGIVLECTDDKSQPKIERKRLQIEHAPYISDQAKLVKLADKICNIHDVFTSPPPNWPLSRQQEYLIWSEKVVEGLRGVNERLESLFDQELSTGKRVLGMMEI